MPAYPVAAAHAHEQVLYACPLISYNLCTTFANASYTTVQ
jgi:hypothetical protein